MVESLTVTSRAAEEFIDITAVVQGIVSRSTIAEGICVVYTPHTTAAVTINENADPDVCRDILGHLAKVVPADKAFRHVEGNSDAHIQASLVGSSVTVLVEDGRLVLGTWQSVFFCEFDGPRSRQMHIKLMPSGGV